MFGRSGNGCVKYKRQIQIWDIGDTGKWRTKEERLVNMLNEKVFWEGGAMLNTRIEEALRVVWT